MTPTIHTFDELKADAEAKFPNAFSRLPSPESFHIQLRQGCTCFKIGEILGDPQDGPVSLHFRRNRVCKHDPLGDEKHILDTPFLQMESPEAKVIPKRMDAFVRYCMLARGHRACLHPPTYDFEIVFRRMCLHGMWQSEGAVRAATQSRAGEGIDEEMVDDAAITGHGTLPGDYDARASIQKSAKLLKQRPYRLLSAWKMGNHSTSTFPKNFSTSAMRRMSCAAFTVSSSPRAHQ